MIKQEMFYKKVLLIFQISIVNLTKKMQREEASKTHDPDKHIQKALKIR